MQNALADWGVYNPAIATALSDEQDYHFFQLDHNNLIQKAVDPNFNVDLIQVALPRLYRHRPLYNVALYHELGHFLDQKHSIIRTSGLLCPVGQGNDWVLQHRAEHLCDLVAACYTGTGISEMLMHISPGTQKTATHPATDDRITLVDDFLNGKNNPMTDLLNQSLTKRGLPSLSIRYTKPVITPPFDDIRPYKIKNREELHGILEAGWQYLIDQKRSPKKPWSQLDEFDPDRIINDLVEKSIRNFMIEELWHNAPNG